MSDSRTMVKGQRTLLDAATKLDGWRGLIPLQVGDCLHQPELTPRDSLRSDRRSTVRPIGCPLA